ncbi:Ion channel [Teladorsagia circumcincta]|uniref:Ion channel n=1 Tax=Teladorsagia circumcincta TaxID=45464 RepID=A0A2G9USX1_TELCI|nr:Ion channel [Teladorsagia circumcincta]
MFSNCNPIKDIAMLFFDLLQAFAIPPNIFIVHRYLNLIYQFWLHSNQILVYITKIALQAVPYLGPLEYFFNTPSSHRVHHGRNPYCIDRNYGGTLIIWDRLFGTYEPERKGEEIAYGLVTPVASFNQLWCQFFEFKAIGYDKGQMKNEKGEELFPGVWNKEVTRRAFFEATMNYNGGSCWPGCDEGGTELEYVRILCAAVPQLFLVSLLTAYLIVGAVLFQSIDEELAKRSFLDIIQFEFGTLTTIGYGNISPTTDSSRMFCILYSILGIPLILLTMANFGKIITKGFWYLMYLCKLVNGNWEEAEILQKWIR